MTRVCVAACQSNPNITGTGKSLQTPTRGTKYSIVPIFVSNVTQPFGVKDPVTLFNFVSCQGYIFEFTSFLSINDTSAPVSIRAKTFLSPTVIGTTGLSILVNVTAALNLRGFVFPFSFVLSLLSFRRSWFSRRRSESIFDVSFGDFAFRFCSESIDCFVFVREQFRDRCPNSLQL